MGSGGKLKGRHRSVGGEWQPQDQQPFVGQNETQKPAGNPGTKIQAVAVYVEQVLDAVLRLIHETTNPPGMMTMSTNMVELLKAEEGILEGKRADLAAIMGKR